MKKLVATLKVTLFAATLALTGTSLMTQSAAPASADRIGNPKPISIKCPYPGCIGGPTRCKNAPLQAKNCFWWPYD